MNAPLRVIVNPWAGGVARVIAPTVAAEGACSAGPAPAEEPAADLTPVR